MGGECVFYTKNSEYDREVPQSQKQTCGIARKSRILTVFVLIFILTDIKTQDLDNSFNLCLEKEGRTTILIVY